MKRTVKLRGELILFIIIATILGLIMSFFITGVYRNLVFGEKQLKILAIERNNNDVEALKRQLHVESKSEEVVYENMKRMEKVLNSAYVNRIFIVDNEGNVKLSTGRLGVKQIDLKAHRGVVIGYNKNFTAVNIIKLTDSRYIVFLNENSIYDDMLIIEIWIAVALIIFTILVGGRVKYISNITKNVRIMAKGNLSNRVPLKYKNELTALAEDINYMAEELEQQEINQKEFITNISHDLRTPLTTILGYSKMLKEKVYSNEEDLQRYISVINRKGIYLKTMLDDFFDYAKLSSKDMEAEKVSINLNESIMQLLEEEKMNFNERGLKLEVSLEKYSLHTFGDPMLIARAFSNLISNSLKYSKPDTTIKIKLESKVINETSYGVFSIYNIPKSSISNNEIGNLFKRLYKRDKSRAEEGSGLGLAITQEIVNVHNGFIGVNMINEGIEFSMGLILEAGK